MTNMAATQIMADLSTLVISADTRSSSTNNTPDAVASSDLWDHVDSDTSDTDVSETPLSTNPEKIKQEANSIALDNYLKTREVGTNEQVSVSTTALRTIEQDDSPPSARIIDQVRDYQQELFERAKEENIIAVYAFEPSCISILTLARLDTGSGKTLIACLLVRHVLDLEEQNQTQDKPRKLVFFLANR